MSFGDHGCFMIMNTLLWFTRRMSEFILTSPTANTTFAISIPCRQPDKRFHYVCWDISHSLFLFRRVRY